MYIINVHGIFTDIPDNRALPAGARKATATEIAEWQEKDAANKLVLREQKMAAAQRRAQLVVVAAPAAPEPEEPKKDKAKPDGKSAA